MKSFDIDLSNLVDTNIYIRFYSGGYRDSSKGHEFLEFDIRHNVGDPFATLRYANHTNYRDEDIIRKELCVSIAVLRTILDVVRESQVLLENDEKWPLPETASKHELEIRCGKNLKIMKTKGVSSLASIRGMEDEEGLKVFYYLVQDLKMLVFSLMSLHFKVKPLQS